MGYILHVYYNKGGFFVTLFHGIGFGATVIDNEKEKSITFAIRLWKIFTAISFALR